MFLDALGDQFTRGDLDEQLDKLQTHRRTRGHATATIFADSDHCRNGPMASNSPTTACFPSAFLYPAMSAEAAGMEDARLRPFSSTTNGSVTFYAKLHRLQRIPHQPAAARDGRLPVVHVDADGGAGAAEKQGPCAVSPGGSGGASPPCPDRTVNRIRLRTRIIRTSGPNRFVANGRYEPWEALQLGNCGPPIETEARGWLLLTHGVGPMRTYRIGAMLLDLEDPTRIVGQLREPLLSPATDEQDGYVPNVVYSCGALVHEGTLVFAVRHRRTPAIGFAMVAAG